MVVRILDARIVYPVATRRALLEAQREVWKERQQGMGLSAFSEVTIVNSCRSPTNPTNTEPRRVPAKSPAHIPTVRERELLFKIHELQHLHLL
eukprot:IDg2653t1